MTLLIAALSVLLPLLPAPLQDPSGGTPDQPPPPPGDDRSGPASRAEMEGPRGLVTNEPETFDGYTLFAPLSSRTTYLVDMEGEVVHEWALDTSPAGGFYLLDDGTLLRAGREDEDPKFHGGGIGGRIQHVAPDGTLVWDYLLADEDIWQHHDVEPLPNGNVLVIAWERLSAEEAVALGRDPDEVGDEGLWTDTILELRPVPPDDAEVVWRWRSRDHLVQDRDPGLPNHGDVVAHPGRIDVNADHRDERPKTAAELAEERELEEQMKALGYVGGEEEEDLPADAEAGDRERRVGGDWLHTNAVNHDPELDLIVLSTPHLSEVWVLDHSTTTAEAATERGGRHGRGGAILWRWGNPRVHGAGDAGDRRLFYQHDPTWIRGPGDEPRILVFNNGRDRSDGDYSSVEELVVPLEDGTFAVPARGPHPPAAPAWSYSDPDGFYSAFISGAQRLPNGNTLICSGEAGRLFEVTREGHVVWDYRNPLSGDAKPPQHAGQAPPLALFRGTRLPADHPGVRKVLGAR